MSDLILFWHRRDLRISDNTGLAAARQQSQKVVQYLKAKGICISERTVTHLLSRYDELLSLWLKDAQRLKAIAHPPTTFDHTPTN
jgi:deoxyribodipyrimidine photolyase